MRVIVTGKQGQVARSLFERASAQGIEVELVGRPELDLTDSGSPLQILDDGFVVTEALVTARIGINGANEAVDWPLRFALEGHLCVSGKKSFIGKRVLLG